MEYLFGVITKLKSGGKLFLFVRGGVRYTVYLFYLPRNKILKNALSKVGRIDHGV